jgi:hypothetical protein
VIFAACIEAAADESPSSGGWVVEFRSRESEPVAAATSTLPSSNNVAVWYAQAKLRLPVNSH